MVKGSLSAVRCLISAQCKAASVNSALNYIARAMEGALPDDAEQ